MSFQDALQRLRSVASLLPEDDPDREEMLTVEGDYSSLMEWALRKRNEHIAQEQAASSLVEIYQDRCGSFFKRAESMRDIVKIIMEAAGERKYQGIAGTVSIKAIPPKPVVVSEELVPEKFWKTQCSLQKSLINEAVKNGETVPGVSMDNGGETLTIRSK